MRNQGWLHKSLGSKPHVSVKRSMLLPLRVTALIALPLWLIGCLGVGIIETDALNYNKALAQHWNDQLFLNAIRASRREPMYFTAVTTASQSVSYTGSLGVELDYTRNTTARGPADKAPFGFSGTPSASIILGPLDSDKFMKGFLSPVDPKVLRLYWELGWPREILLHLFVRTFSVSLPPEKDLAKELSQVDEKIIRPLAESFLDEAQLKDIASKAADQQPAARASAVASGLIEWLKRFGLKPGSSEIFEGLLDEWGPDRSSNDITHFLALEEDYMIRVRHNLAKTSLTEEEQDKLFKEFRDENDILRNHYAIYWKYRLFVQGLAEALLAGEGKIKAKGVPPLVLKWGVSKPVGPEVTAQEAKDPKFLQLAQKEGYGIEPGKTKDTYNLVTRETALKLVFKTDGKEQSPEINLGEIVIRSPEAMLYHLGEMIRFCTKYEGMVPTRVYLSGHSPYMPLFRTQTQLNSGESALLKISHDNVGYFIVKENPDTRGYLSGETIHVLELVSQLVLLYKSSDGLPSAGVVTLIGR